jgi:acyl-CoA reductase-like NAD-dependent aldehyde dehydrogenase
MSQTQTTIIPHTQAAYVTRIYPSPDELGAAIEASAKAQKEWAKVPLTERIGVGRRFMEEFEKMRNDIAKELTIQMGRCGAHRPRCVPLTEAENQANQADTWGD